MKLNRKQIILSMQMAFLGAICNKIRIIAFDITESLFTLYVYVDSSLSEDEYEAVSSAVTDILADFPELLSEKIEIIETNEKISSLDLYEGCFFMRFENQFNE